MLRRQPGGVLSVYAVDESPLRFARSDRDAARRRSACRVRASSSPRARPRGARFSAWGLELVCAGSGRVQQLADRDHDARRPRCRSPLRASCSNDSTCRSGTGLGKLKGRSFRIGHLGDFNDLMLAGTLSGVEMGLAQTGVPFAHGGVTAALEYLASNG